MFYDDICIALQLLNLVLFDKIWWTVRFVRLVKKKKTSFLLKRNRPKDQNKMISKVCGCKMG